MQALAVAAMRTAEQLTELNLFASIGLILLFVRAPMIHVLVQVRPQSFHRRQLVAQPPLPPEEVPPRRLVLHVRSAMRNVVA